MTMPTLAKSIEIRDNRVFIDGEEFSWYVADDPIISESDPNSLTRVTLTLYTDKFVSDLSPPEPVGPSPMSKVDLTLSRLVRRP